MQVSSRELLEFLEGSDDDDRDRRKRRRRKPRMWRSARERASWKSDMRQVSPAVTVRTQTHEMNIKSCSHEQESPAGVIKGHITAVLTSLHLVQATTLPRVAYCTMALVVSAAEMLDAIDARKARRCGSVHAHCLQSGCSPMPGTTPGRCASIWFHQVNFPARVASPAQYLSACYYARRRASGKTRNGRRTEQRPRPRDRSTLAERASTEVSVSCVLYLTQHRIPGISVA